MRIVFPEIEENIKKTAEVIKREREKGAYFIVRHHNDADGICGALVISKIVKARFYASQSATYSFGDAVRDIALMQDKKERAVLMLLDFGSGRESEKAIDVVLSSGFKIILIDHHPRGWKNEKTNITVLNPTDSREDGSQITTGYLCSAVAEKLGVVCEEYGEVSLCSDKSEYAEETEDRKKIAKAINYSCFHNAGLPLRYYENIFKSKENRTPIMEYAMDLEERAVPEMRKIFKKTDVGGVELYVGELGTLVKKMGLPGMGKTTTMAFESICGNDNPKVMVAYSKKHIILRQNKKSEEMGLDFRKVVEQVKKSYSNYVIMGGGHPRASAITVVPGFENSVKNAVVEEIKKEIMKK